MSATGPSFSERAGLLAVGVVAELGTVVLPVGELLDGVLEVKVELEEPLKVTDDTLIEEPLDVVVSDVTVLEVITVEVVAEMGPGPRVTEREVVPGMPVGLTLLVVEVSCARTLPDMMEKMKKATGRRIRGRELERKARYLMLWSLKLNVMSMCINSNVKCEKKSQCATANNYQQPPLSRFLGQGCDASFHVVIFGLV